ncbi:MAG: transposase [Anaerolineales bacterium]|nr:transposase [Anaerolineales bacterium]
MTLLIPFQPLFRQPTWRKAQILFIGAIMATGKRTVTAALRVMGLENDPHFANYHQVLNRAVWSPRRLSEMLLALLLKILDSDETKPLVFGIDETIERRWGPQIAKRGIYRDAVRSSKSHFVKTSGLRWISLMWLQKIAWAERIWALPFFTVLAPSERYQEQVGRQHKKITDWARQMIFQLRRWLPHRLLIVVADYSYAALAFLHACQTMVNPVTVITRLRLDAALYEPAPPPTGKAGRPRKKGKRLPTLQARVEDPQTKWQSVKLHWYDGQTRQMVITSQTAVWYHNGLPLVPVRWVLVYDPQGQYETIALLSTALELDPLQIVNWFVQRWQVEVTFEEVRTHLGVETQRQWSDKAIERTTPILLGLFSWITLAAHLLVEQAQLSVRQAAWYVKERPTFSDSLGAVRQQLWFPATIFSISPAEPDVVKIPRSLFDRLVDTVCYST